MRTIQSRWVALALVAIGPAVAAHDRPSNAGNNRPAFVFSSIDVPGAASTRWAGGVNSRGDVVGAYRDSSGNTHGYVLNGGVFTTIDYPGAVYTAATGI